MRGSLHPPAYAPSRRVHGSTHTRHLEGPACIFCGIVAGEAPATALHEDDAVVAFLDAFPVNPGHALVVPREHHLAFTEVPHAHLHVIPPRAGDRVEFILPPAARP